MLSPEEWFVEHALAYVGCHYIWQGKCRYIWTPSGLVKHGFINLANPPLPLDVFDCSGLVTHSLWLATSGNVDLRETHSAQTMLDTFPLANSEEDGVIKLYPGHVSISLGRGRVLEAAGGDHTTTSIQAAIDHDARVRVGRDLRTPSALLGLRRIPLDKSELRTV
jgi:hypothetical protein